VFGSAAAAEWAGVADDASASSVTAVALASRRAVAAALPFAGAVCVKERCELAPAPADCVFADAAGIAAPAVEGGVVPAGGDDLAADSAEAEAVGVSDFGASNVVICTLSSISRSRGGMSHTSDTPITTTQAVAIPPSHALFRGQRIGQNDSLLRPDRAVGR
jgi:hypothetical protein